MAGSSDEPLGESHRLSRPAAAARNSALDRVDLLLEANAPQSGAAVGVRESGALLQRNTDGDGEAKEGSGWGDRSTGNEYSAGRGPGPARVDVSRGGGGRGGRMRRGEFLHMACR